MAGWFSTVSIDEIPDNPNELPNNTYKFQITSAELKPTKDKSKTGITFKYQIIEGPWANFFPLVDWVRVPDQGTKPDEIERMLSYLKMRLLAFGFTPDEIQEFEPGSEMQTLNRVFYGTTSARKDKDNNVQIRVVKFDPVSEDGDSSVDFPDDDI